MPSARPHQQKNISSARPRSIKQALLLTMVSAGMVVVVLYFMFRQKADTITPNSSSTMEEKQSITTDIPETKNLVGRWVRPDGGYVLEIRSTATDGKLDVGYYNPNSIKVARAEWVLKDGKLYVMVELQDVNYPGSVYGLEYNSSQDHLLGTYYQAVEKSTYDVQFVREKLSLF